MSSALTFPTRRRPRNHAPASRSLVEVSRHIRPTFTLLSLLAGRRAPCRLPPLLDSRASARRQLSAPIGHWNVLTADASVSHFLCCSVRLPGRLFFWLLICGSFSLPRRFLKVPVAENDRRLLVRADATSVTTSKGRQHTETLHVGRFLSTHHVSLQSALSRFGSVLRRSATFSFLLLLQRLPKRRQVSL